MAIILRHKSTIYGLVGDLSALQAADASEASTRQLADEAELAARVAAITAEATTRAAAITAEENARIAAILAEETARIAADQAEATTRAAAISSEEAARIAGDTSNTNALQAHIDGAFTTAKNLLDVVNGSDTTDGSFRKAIADVIAAAPSALDTLKEIADYINVNPNANVADAIINSVTTAVNDLKGNVSTAMDTLAEIEAAINTEISNRVTAVSAEESARISAVATEEAARIAGDAAEEAARIAAVSSEEAARIAADSALDTSLKAYADAAATNGGSIPKLESLTVVSNKIVLTKAPKAGLNGIMNFGTVRYVDVNGVAFDAPVLADGTDATGKTFIVSVDASGDWDGKQVQVQYLYVNV